MITPQQALRDQGIVRQVHAAQSIGRQIVSQQRALRQANPTRNNPATNPARQPGLQRQNERQNGLPQRQGPQPALPNRPAQPPGLQRQTNAPGVQRPGPPNRPAPQRRPAAPKAEAAAQAKTLGSDA